MIASWWWWLIAIAVIGGVLVVIGRVTARTSRPDVEGGLRPGRTQEPDITPESQERRG